MVVLARLRRMLLLRVGLPALLAVGSASAAWAEAHPHCAAPSEGGAVHSMAGQGTNVHRHAMHPMGGQGASALRSAPDCPHCPPQDCARSTSCVGSSASLAAKMEASSAAACHRETEPGAVPARPVSAATTPPIRPPRLSS